MVRRLAQRVGLAVIALALGGAGQQDGAFARWRIKDRCIHGALVHFPDHDAVSLQKRDAEVDQCLIAAHLPPVEHLAAPAPSLPAEGAAPPGAPSPAN